MEQGEQLETLAKEVRTMRGAILELNEHIKTMDQQLAETSAELLGFKLAFIRLSAFLPLTSQDATGARELAFAAAEADIEQAGMPNESALVALSTIHRTMEIAGSVWRQRIRD